MIKPFLVLGSFLCIVQFLAGCGPKPEQFAPLKNGRITTLPDTKMMVVEAIGEPDKTVGKAFGLLFKTAYKMKTKSWKPGVPLARWPLPLETPRNEWIGLFAMRIPEETQTLPKIESKDGLSARIEVWKYGTIAEILHIGRYSQEPPTVNKLKKVMKAEGYEMAGPHEEEYIKGPGMFFKGNPESYLTIIRWPVRKTAAIIPDSMMNQH